MSVLLVLGVSVCVVAVLVVAVVLRAKSNQRLLRSLEPEPAAAAATPSVPAPPREPPLPQRIAEIIGGTISHEQDDQRRIHITGEYAGHPVRFLSDGVIDKLTLELKLPQEAQGTEFNFQAFFDPKPEERAKNQLAPDSWDDAKVSYFISRRVFLEGRTRYVKKQKECWERVQGEETAQLLQLMETSRLDFFTISGGTVNRITARFRETAPSAAVLRAGLDAAVGIYTAASRVW